VGDRLTVQERTCREAIWALAASLPGEEPRLG
jgi:hypothetical protein